MRRKQECGTIYYLSVVILCFVWYGLEGMLVKGKKQECGTVYYLSVIILCFVWYGLQGIHWELSERKKECGTHLQRLPHLCLCTCV